MDGKLRNMTAVYITCAGRMLLLYRQGSRVVNNLWVGSAGGHFEEFELNDARACALREMEEELGLKENAVKSMALRYVTLRRTKGEIRQNYYFFAELRQDVKLPLASNEGLSQWFTHEELSTLEMPFTAKYVVEHYINVGSKTKDLYGGIADGEKVVFIKMPEF